MTSRRVVVWLPAHALMALLGDWRRAGFVALPWLAECADGRGRRVALPRDAEVVSVVCSWERRAFGVMLTHPSFAEVPEGEMPPELAAARVSVELLPVAADAPDAVVVEVPPA